MITGYLTIYLIFIIVVSLVVSLLFVKLKLPAPRILIPLIVFFILSPVIAGYFYLVYFDSLPETIVPDVVGLTKQAAAGKIEEAQLKVRLAGEVKQLNFPAGTIVSQRPEAGRRVKVGRGVSLMISAGKQQVTVPDLVGKPFSQAAKMLDAAELRAGDLSRETHSDLPEGTVLAQEPLPGETAAMGSLVDLLISTQGEITEEAK